MERKQLKKTCRKSVWLLLSYNIIMYVVFMAGVIAQLVMEWSRGRNIDLLIEDDAYWEQVGNSATSYFITVVLGILLIAVFQRSKNFWKEIRKKEKSMDKITILKLFFVFMMPQFLFLVFDSAGEMILNHFGYSMSLALESATEESTTLGMLCYAGILGPVAEELWFRGVILKSAMPYGKRFAVVVSSVLFGIFHGNFPQAFAAVFIGLVLGYVAAEYSIYWSIALHIFNNLVMGDGLNYLLRGFGENVQNRICNGMIILLFLVGIGILWHDRRKVKKFFQVNKKGEPRWYLWYFTMGGTLVFLGINVLTALTGISRI